MFDAKVKLNQFEASMEAFESVPVETGKILFVGDSSFTRWRTEKYGFRPMAEDLRGKNGEIAVINHGFGTSTAEHVLYYYDRVIRPWAPRVLVLEEFANDFAAGYSPAEIVFFLSRVCAYARTDFPGIKIYICDVRPLKKTVNNGSWINHVKQYNALLKDYCDKHEDCTYVCHSESPLFYDDPANVGSYKDIRTDIFVADEVHYNQEGYNLYRDFFLKVLDSEL